MRLQLLQGLHPVRSVSVIDGLGLDDQDWNEGDEDLTILGAHPTGFNFPWPMLDPLKQLGFIPCSPFVVLPVNSILWESVRHLRNAGIVIREAIVDLIGGALLILAQLWTLRAFTFPMSWSSTDSTGTIGYPVCEGSTAALKASSC